MFPNIFEEREMKTRMPLTYEEAKQLIVGKNGLAPKFHQMIVQRNETADNSVFLAIHTLKYDVMAERIRGEIADVVRRYNLDCPDCKERKGDDYHGRILCDWHLANRETLLKCHFCENYIVIEDHYDKERIKELISLAPVPIPSLFMSER